MSATLAIGRAARIRKTFLMQLRPGKGIAEEYIRAHDALPADMRDVLKAHGVHQYTISLQDATGQLFAYVEIEDEARWDAIGKTEACQRWWRQMSELMETDEEGRPKVTPVRPVFFLP